MNVPVELLNGGLAVPSLGEGLVCAKVAAWPVGEEMIVLLGELEGNAALVGIVLLGELEGNAALVGIVGGVIISFLAEVTISGPRRGVTEALVDDILTSTLRGVAGGDETAGTLSGIPT